MKINRFQTLPQAAGSVQREKADRIHNHKRVISWRKRLMKEEGRISMKKIQIMLFRCDMGG
jgi:hypothetical protein